MDNLVEVVKDKHELKSDPAKEHVHHNSQMILSGIAEDYQEGSVLADLTSGEKRRLEETSLNYVLSADCPAVIRQLKLESLTEFMVTLEMDLNTLGEFHPEPSMIFKLNEITYLGTEAMKIDGTRIKKLLIKIVADDIVKKNDVDTPLTDLSRGEKQVLQNMRPLLDETEYPKTAVALHWRIIEQDLDEDFEKLASDPEYEVQNKQKLICFYSRKNVPENIKTKALELRKLNENVIVERLPHKYNLNSNVDELTETEKVVLRYIRPLDDDKLYPEVVLALHWRIIEQDLDEDFEKLASDPEYEVQNIPKLMYFYLRKNVPENIKTKALELRKLNENVIVERLPHKYNLNSNVDELTETEKVVLRYIRPLDDDILYPEVVLALHWRIIEQDLDEDFEKLASNPEFEVQNIPKLIYFYSHKNVPENIKTKALELRKLNENVIVERLPHKYNLNSNVDELTETEKVVLRYIRPLDDDKLYPEVVLALHWRIIEQDLDEDFEKLASVPEYEVQNIPKLIYFYLCKNVPENIKTKALELRKLNENVIVERLPHKYNLNSNVDELTETEKVVLDRLDVIRNSYHPLVEYLHWEHTHVILCKKWRAFKAGDLEIANYMPKKLAFLSTNDRVPDITKQLAKEFQEAMSREEREAWKKHTDK